MGMWERLKGRGAKPPVKAAVVGEGPAAERLASAYEITPGVETVGSEIVRHADGVVRAPVVRPAPLASFDAVIRTAGLRAMEIVAPVEQRFDLAAAALKAGLFASVEAPAGTEELHELERLADVYGVPVRIRLDPLYYPPYQETRRLAQEEAVGRPMALKLLVRRGRGTELAAGQGPGQWIIAHELGFIALAPWLIGPIEKVYARLGRPAGEATPPSALVMWKYSGLHQYGHLQVDFCPGLHVRTFTEPVHRFIEVTCVGGTIMATRGEGQLLRMPALIVRGKSTTTTLEMVPDDWREVYKNLARETLQVLNNGAAPLSTPAVATDAVKLVRSAMASAQKGDETALG
jgi:predicted dehydrogenase